MVGIDCKQVLPAWFRVLAATAGPAEYARRFETFVDRHCNYQRAELLAEARQVATPAQRKELAERPCRENHAVSRLPLSGTAGDGITIGVCRE